MAHWDDFEAEAPALARLGRMLLPERARAFLSTIRGDGGPRTHPVCPLFARPGIYVAVSRHSPKSGDLARDGRFVLHAALGPGDAEFRIQGIARQVTGLTAAMADNSIGPRMRPDDVLFELDVDEAFGTLYRVGPDGCPMPEHRRWRDRKTVA